MPFVARVEEWAPAAPTEAPLLAVHLLGPLHVAIDGTPVRRWPSGRGRSLFKYLLTHRHPWPHREALMEVFWPQSTPEAAGDQDGATAEYELAASVYRGDFLTDDPYEEWPVLTRERLRLVFLDVLDRLSRRHLEQGRPAASAALCQRILERDACREDAHRRLMRCYARQGQPQLALRQYRACAAALRAELKVDPAPATTRLREAIRHRQPV
jgi:DNA-binding SARP family transcriptional activator